MSAGKVISIEELKQSHPQKIPRSKGGRPVTVDREKVLFMIKNKLPLKSIAAELGVSYSTVVKINKKVREAENDL